MTVPAPHFLLYPEAAQPAGDLAAASRWRFVIRSKSGETALEAADEEIEASPERLELLAIVRGLEALDQPSRVTLMATSRNFRRGFDFGLIQWRENGWHWERYGQLTPVKNRDLWQRLDRLLEIHAVECRAGRLEKADDLAAPRAPVCRGRRIRIDRPATSVPRSAWDRAASRSAAYQSVGRRASKQFRPTQSVGRRGWSLDRIAKFMLRFVNRPATTQDIVQDLATT